MDTEQYYVFDPNDPLGLRTKKRIDRPINPNRQLKLGLIFIIIAVILLIGLVAAAYFMKVWPFAGVDSMQLLQNSFKKLNGIESLSYDYSFSLKSAPKDANSQPFNFVDPSLQGEIMKYQKDDEKLSSASQTLSSLKSKWFLDKKYPKTDEFIQQLQITDGDNYQYISDGKKFTLKMTFETDAAINELKFSNTTINGKEVTFSEQSYFYYSGRLKAPSPLFVQGYSQIVFMIGNLPGNFDFNMNMSGSVEKAEKPAVTFKIGANVNYEDLIFTAEGESLLKNENIYLKLNKFPGLPFFDLSNIKGQWVKIAKDDLTSLSSYIPEQQLKQKPEELLSEQEQGSLIGKIAGEEKIIVLAQQPKKETIENVGVYHYQFKIDKAKLASFYTRVTTELKNQYQDKAVITFDQKILDDLNAPATLALIDYLNDHSSVDIYIDRKTGYPMQVSASFQIIPGSDVKNQNMAVFSSTIKLKDINGTITITEPKDAITIEDAYLKLQGLSKDQYLIQQQVENIREVRDGLLSFKTLAGKYPDFLDQLDLTRIEIKKLNPSYSANSTSSFFLDSSKLLYREIPKDEFTKQSFGYTKTADNNYRLSYQMVFPEYQKGKKVIQDIFSLSAITSSPRGLKFISGLNTADASNISLEAKDQNTTDTDKDGLSDTLEAYIGTDQKQKDTDKDGYTDGEELKMGYDPNGPGVLQ